MKTVIGINSQAAYNALMMELERMGKRWFGGGQLPTEWVFNLSPYKLQIHVFSDGDIAWARQKDYSSKNDFEFKVGMQLQEVDGKITVVPSANQATLQKLNELKVKVAELEAELNKPVEPLYTVTLPTPNSTAKFMLKRGDGHGGSITLLRVTDSVYATNSKSLRLTESEIKQDFEWAWQFAERVEQ